jgi:hypothetical protein
VLGAQLGGTPVNRISVCTEASEELFGHTDERSGLVNILVDVLRSRYFRVDDIRQKVEAVDL